MYRFARRGSVLEEEGKQLSLKLWSPVASASSPSSAAHVSQSLQEEWDLRCTFEGEHCEPASLDPSSCCQAFATWPDGSGTKPAIFDSCLSFALNAVFAWAIKIKGSGG